VKDESQVPNPTRYWDVTIAKLIIAGVGVAEDGQSGAELFNNRSPIAVAAQTVLVSRSMTLQLLTVSKWIPFDL